MVDNQEAAVAVDIRPPSNGYSGSLDEDTLIRTGSVWTTSAHIITAAIGSGVLSLAWCAVQLGWAGLTVAMLLFSAISAFTSFLLAECHFTAATGQRNFTFFEAVDNILGGSLTVGAYIVIQVFTGLVTMAGFSIACATSLRGIKNSNIFDNTRARNFGDQNLNTYIIIFGAIQILISQLSTFHILSWVSIFSGVIPIFYSSLWVYLGTNQIIENRTFKGSLRGMRIGVGEKQNWRVLEALGEIAFSYSLSNVFFEIQNMTKSPEKQTMKKASFLSIVVSTFGFILFASVGYAAFGDSTPNDLSIGFELCKPHWLVDLANVAIVLRLARDYQLTCQPIFALMEKQAIIWFPTSNFVSRDIRIHVLGFELTSFNLFRMTLRTLFVIITTVITLLFPFFNDAIALAGGIAFWPLSVFFPVEMYIKQKMIRKWTTRWVGLQVFSLSCLIFTIAAVAGSVAGLVFDRMPSNKLSEINY